MAPEMMRSFAMLLRSGLSVRLALARWHQSFPEVEALWVVARRIELGAPVSGSLEPLEAVTGFDVSMFRMVIEVGMETGGDLAAVVDCVADVCEQRDAARRAVRAHVAGVTMSARLVGVLPLLFLPMVPVSWNDLWDPVGLGLIVAGVALCLFGLRWVKRLVPDVSERDEATGVAAVVTAAVRGGCSLRSAFDVCAHRGSPALRRAERRVKLGLTWPQALSRCEEPGLRALGTHLESSEGLGVPVAGSLEAFGRARAAESVLAFDREMRRAPVKMIVPLTVCILPAFLLLGAAPFLRALLTPT